MKLFNRYRPSIIETVPLVAIRMSGVRRVVTGQHRSSVIAHSKQVVLCRRTACNNNTYSEGFLKEFLELHNPAFSWTDHRSNQEVLDMVDKTEAWWTPSDRQKNWSGHVLRSESVLHRVLEGRMEGTRTRGRQSATMIDWLKRNHVEYEHIKKRVYDREDWLYWRPGLRQSTQE